MNVTESMVIVATPDAVWAVGGDVGNIADWIPAIEKSHMVGAVRHATSSTEVGTPRSGSSSVTTSDGSTSTST